MEWTVLVSLITSSIQICYSTRTQEASYFCEKQDNNLVAKFRLVRNNDTIYQIIGHTAAEPDPDQSSPVTSCADISTDSQKDIYYLNVTIDIQTSTSYPTCGVYTVVTGKQYKMRIRSQTTKGIKSVADAYYDFICDVQMSLASWVRATTLGHGSLTDTNLQPFQSSLSFWLMDYATNIPLFGEVELGREMYYQIGFQSCFKQDTKYDTCGHEFWIAFQSLGNPSDSILTLYILNPSSSSISVQIESENSTLPCSPIIVAPNSFGSCSVDNSFEITTSSCKAIYVSSQFQCIYIQRQHYTSQDFSVIPILPVDTIRQSYRALSSVQDTEIIIVSLNSTSIDITPSGGSPVTIETERFETYSYQFGSGSDISGSSVISDNVVAIFQKETLANGYGLQQLLGEWSAGKTYVIPFVTSSTDTWKCLILKDSTDVSYSSSTSSQNAGDTVTGSVSSFMEISSTKPVLCQVYSGDTSISLFSFEQWSSTYSFVLKHNEISYKLLIVTTSADKDLLVLNINGILTIIVGTWMSVTKVTGSSLDLVALEMPVDLTGITNDVLVTLSHPSVNFQVVLLSTHSSSDRKTLTLVPGFNSVYSNVESCTETLGYVGDLIDNDCDGIADEDLLKSSGVNYADLKGIQQENTCFEKIRVNDCDVSPDPKFENSVQRIIENGCVTANINDPFRPMSDFTYDSTKSDNITQIYRSGKVELVGFDGYDEIYLRCNVHFCFKYDSSCDTSCTKRRKRDVHSSNTVSDKLITLSDLQQITTSDESCFDSSAFISVISVLSIVFATLLCTILYFFVRLYQLTEIRRTQLNVSS